MSRGDLDVNIGLMLEELEDAAGTVGDGSWEEDVFRRAHAALVETRDALYRCRKGRE